MQSNHEISIQNYKFISFTMVIFKAPVSRFQVDCNEVLRGGWVYLCLPPSPTILLFHSWQIFLIFVPISNLIACSCTFVIFGFRYLTKLQKHFYDPYGLISGAHTSIVQDSVFVRKHGFYDFLF